MERHNLSEEAQNVMARIWNEVQQTSNAAERKAAQANPKAHKLSKLFENASYRYFSAGRDANGHRIAFCYSCHPNAAGYFLTWREMTGSDGCGSRDLWVAHKQRKVAKAFARDCAKERLAKLEQRALKEDQ